MSRSATCDESALKLPSNKFAEEKFREDLLPRCSG